MRYTENEVVAAVEHLTVTRLHAWVDSGCVRPGATAAFTETDMARLRLLCTLADDLGVDDESIPLVLSLIDQIHGLRGALRDLTGAVNQEAPEVRQRIADAFRAAGAGHGAAE
ncbi:MAG: hypothetical protein VR70_03445 [Rhodospirillaceae bacterium BRH_c57]|nr:MAG: hypothetical protein VR70_03445 [Rhodospirillaceae bacterium BRH_c57]